MRREFPVATVLSMIGLVAGLAPAFGCSGGGGGGVTPSTPSAAFTESGSAAAPDLVRLRKSATTGNRVVLEVALGGPTQSGDIYSFAFDLVLGDPTVAKYVSATATVGDALTASGGQTLQAEATQSGDRIVVGVTKLGGGAGNGTTAAESVIIRLALQVLKTGRTTVAFGGSTSPQNPTAVPAAIDSSGGLLASVVFDPTPAVVEGR